MVSVLFRSSISPLHYARIFICLFMWENKPINSDDKTLSSSWYRFWLLFGSSINPLHCARILIYLCGKINSLITVIQFRYSRENNWAEIQNFDRRICS